MKPLLREIWTSDRKSFLTILCGNILSSFLGGIGIVMLIPLLNMLQIGDSRLPEAFTALSYPLRVGILLTAYVLLVTVKALLSRALSIRESDFIEETGRRLREWLYQAVSGAGAAGLAELEEQVRDYAAGKSLSIRAFPYQIAFNVLPQIGSDSGNGYTTEEMKMQNEGRKILHLPELRATCTCVRVPVLRSHSISVTLVTERKISVSEAREAIANAPGCKLTDDLESKLYPTPLDTSDQDLVYVGRIRDDLTNANGLTLFCCGDQIRKGAALNTLQIAEVMIKNGWLENIFQMMKFVSYGLCVICQCRHTHYTTNFDILQKVVFC